MNLSRRQWLACAAGAGLLKADAPPLFAEVPAAESGIQWVHDNAMSPEHYLPEALGPGCAFLDYDNDGWMDIYLVNSGPCDFFQPPSARCGTRCIRTIATAPLPTSPKKPESPAAPSAWASPSAITTTTAGPISSSPPTGAACSTRTTATARLPTSAKQAGIANAGMDHQRRLVRLRQRRPAGSIRLQLRRLRPRRASLLRREQAWAGITTASRASSKARLACCITTMAMARLPKWGMERRSAKRWAKAWAWSRRTSIMTGGWISSSPTTRCRISCS